ncbi:MAG TPA: hypothetical protein VFK80_04150, partial [Limnochordia bacterium]|nr:hypothetical protein [Limnochordia bacterium]
PAQLQQMPADEQALLANPRVLTDPSALGAIHQQLQGSGQAGEQLFVQLVNGLRHGLADALHGVFVLGFVVAIITVVVTFALPEIPLRGRGPAEAGRRELGSARGTPAGR